MFGNKQTNRHASTVKTKVHHLIDWTENADPVFCNRAYMNNMNLYEMLCYVFHMFGLRPFDPLPTHVSRAYGSVICFLFLPSD